MTNNVKKETENKTGAVLVVGGGIGGMQGALDLAESGFKVYLLEEKPSIGGVMAQLDKTFPTNDCSMCIMAPKLVEAGRHRNIEVVSCGELAGLEGEPGDFLATIQVNPRYIDTELCTGCGACAEKCPAEAVDLFNEGLSDRHAISVEYPQAVPRAYYIDRDHCIGCGLCEKLCLAGAVKYDDSPRERVLQVGAVILSPGCGEFSPNGELAQYGYGRFHNVVTSIEFERILSASGPYRGRVLKPYDGDIPRKMAWIQCVGSRDRSLEKDYCSSVCCMYAIKEAVIAREHEKEIEPTIFFMDLRAFGKGFDRYYERAREDGVRFIRSRVASVEKAEETDQLLLSYETESGELISEEFDMVVLSVGLEPGGRARDTAQRLGVDLDRFGFADTGTLKPLSTNRPGIFVCGSFQSPKDIPGTVTQSSGAACLAARELSPARGTLVVPPEYPEEREVYHLPPRIGVFVCHCGRNIGAVVDVPEVVEYARSLPHVAHAEQNLYTCSEDTQDSIVDTIEEKNLNRVVVASCSPRTHEPLFQETVRKAGLNPYLFTMTNIRDQDSWVHMNYPRKATEKAKDLVKMAVSRARLLRPLSRQRLPVNKAALVIGGGVAGMNAALDLADQGFECHLVEREDELGGMANKIYRDLEGNDIEAYLEDLMERVKSHDLIHLHNGMEVVQVEGYVGNYRTGIEPRESGAAKGQEGDRVIEHGIVIIATGAEEYSPDEYLYGKNPAVVTQAELEKLLIEDQDEVKEIKEVVMIQCVGSRTDERPYCSRICCGEAVKNALLLKESDPDRRVYVLYRDMRTYSFHEEYYSRARDAGVIFLNYDPDDPPRVEEQNGKLVVEIEDRLLEGTLAFSPDLLALSAATVPNPDNQRLSRLYKVPLTEDGFFLEAHMKLRPVDFSTDGVYMCGMAHSPKYISETMAEAHAAVSRATTVLSRDTIEAEGTVARVDDFLCTGCSNCVELCAYAAVELDPEKNIASVNAALCKGCGACAAGCRCGAMTLDGFDEREISAELDALLL